MTVATRGGFLDCALLLIAVAVCVDVLCVTVALLGCAVRDCGCVAEALRGRSRVGP